MFGERDILPGGPEALLSERGLAKYAVARITLGSVLALSAALLVGGMAWAIRMEPWAGASALNLTQARLKADALARLKVAGLREEILTAALQEVVKEPPSTDRETRVANLKRLMADQRRDVRDARTQIDHEEEGDFQALTTVNIGGRTYPLNNTNDGHLRPEVVAAFLHNDKFASALIQAANQRALAQAPLNLDAIIQSDLAQRLETQK